MVTWLSTLHYTLLPIVSSSSSSSSSSDSSSIFPFSDPSIAPRILASSNSPWFRPPLLPIRSMKRNGLFFPVLKCLTKSAEEKLGQEETLAESESESEVDDDRSNTERVVASAAEHSRFTSSPRAAAAAAAADSISLGIREPVYEVVEVRANGVMSTRKISRRQLLKSSGLRPRDVRSVDPSLWLTNSMPSLLVRENAILLNLGTLRAIAMQERVFIFDYNRKGGKAFLDHLLPRLNPKDINGVPSMPFELEVVEAALLSRIQRLERRLMAVEPRVIKTLHFLFHLVHLLSFLEVVALLEVLPNRLTADVLEELRLSKQTLVELGSRAGALKQMLLDLLEDPEEIRRICVMGRNCTIRKGNSDMECSTPSEKEIAEEEEEEIEMLLENYLQRCESCHGHAERLLDSAKEMEDSIAVNLSSRRLEVSRVELLLQVGTFCVAVGALVAGIFGMNLKSYLEEHVIAFWLTTAGIIFGAVVAFFLMYYYLKARRIL
ncbi:hypothetical protein Syun_000585 [Stephania yunnanensis]|uniref:Magnesium transporter n=1 Tax=Stephania yunnanensis TaxID=152371 RepID=A0AAP0Q5P8_9MAGN